MNGVALLVSLATLAAPGVEYSFRKAADSQQEYTIQIPSEFLSLVSDGQEIQSDVPPEAGQVQRLCIRVGTRVERTAAAERLFRQLLVSAGRYASADRNLVAAEPQPTILWPARTNPDPAYSVRTGWQPDSSGNQFFVQIDRTLLGSLASGDEIYVPVDPAAGRPTRFIVRTGTDQDELPRISPRPAQEQPFAQKTGEPKTQTAAGRMAGDNSQSTWEGSRFGAGSFEAPPASGPTSNSVASNSAPSGSFASRDRSPPLSGGGAALPALSDSPSRPPTGYAPRAAETQIADARGSSAPPASIPANSDYQRGNFPPQTDITPVPSLAPPVATSYAPAGASQPPPLQPAPQFSQPAPHYAPSPPAHQVAQVAALPPAATYPVATMANTAVAPLAAASPVAVQPPTKETWGPFVLVLFALFFSIGGNMYLAWTALEFHSRYRNAMQRLRTAARNA